MGSTAAREESRGLPDLPPSMTDAGGQEEPVVARAPHEHTDAVDGEVFAQASRSQRRLSAGTSESSESTIGGHCDSIHALSERPTIDGVLEAGLDLSLVVPQGWTAQQAIPEGNSLFFALAWHADGIYFFAEVMDPERSPAPLYASVWAGDGLEFFLDHDARLIADGSYDAVGTRALIVGAPLSDDSNGERAAVFRGLQSLNQASQVDWISSPTPTGYVVEASLRAGDLGLETWSLEAGRRIAFNLAHNVSFPKGVSGPDGNRMGQYVLQLPVAHAGQYMDYPQLSTHSFCQPVLSPL